jgi:hypothetical protein
MTKLLSQHLRRIGCLRYVLSLFYPQFGQENQYRYLKPDNSLEFIMRDQKVKSELDGCKHLFVKGGKICLFFIVNQKINFE